MDNPSHTPAHPPAYAFRESRLLRAHISSSWRDSSLLPTAGFDAAERFHKAVLFSTLFCTILWLGIWLLERIGGMEIVPGSAFSLELVLSGAGILLLAGQRRRWAWASHMHTAVAYQIFVSAVIIYWQSRLPSGLELRMGDSAVATWIVFFATFVTMPPRATGIGSLGSALMVPLLPLLAQPPGLATPLGMAGLAIWSLPSFAMASWVIWLSKRHDALIREAQTARDLGSYRLMRKIGQGGMGEVWEARHHTLARDAAVKVVRAVSLRAVSGNDLQIAKERFRREAAIIASLRSPHTVQLYDFGSTLDQSFYYVMELLPGMDLQQMVHRFGPLPPGRAIHFLRQACRSLAEAHKAGIVHRDIKPSNLFASRLGVEADFLKVLDFGLARRDTPDMQQLTAAGSLPGTPAYLAPELLRGPGGADARVDIYALGCVGYYLITGSPVFEGTNLIAVALAHLEEAPCPPSLRTDRHIPADLEQVLLRCLAKDPGERYQSAGELADALAACGSAADWTEQRAQEWWDLHGESRQASTEHPCREHAACGSGYTQ